MASATNLMIGRPLASRDAFVGIRSPDAENGSVPFRQIGELPKRNRLLLASSTAT